MSRIETARTARSDEVEPVPNVRTALVLGAGGTVGIAYHAGVLKAMLDAGVDPAAADLVVGTSAGAVVGSILRAGHDLDEIWDYALSDENPFAEGEPFFRPEVVFSQGWRTPAGLARRAVGSGYVLQRSVMPFMTLAPPKPLQRFYRGGLASVTEQRAEFTKWVGEEWPDRPLNLCTFDIVTGRRLVLGEPGRRRPALPDAIRAAAAVPTLYPPVRFGRRVLVDGGVSSSTNLDVAVAAGAELVVVAAPLAYEPGQKLPLHLRAARELFQRKLECELRDAERLGVQVLVIRPDRDEALAHGLNFLRSGDNRSSAVLANERAERILAEHRSQEFTEAWRAATAPPPRRAARRTASANGSSPARVERARVAQVPVAR